MSNLGTFLSRAKESLVSSYVMKNGGPESFGHSILSRITSAATNWGKVKECYIPKNHYTGKPLDINALHEYGQSALMNAAAAADFVAMKLLIEHGADPTLTDNNGKLCWIIC